MIKTLPVANKRGKWVLVSLRWHAHLARDFRGGTPVPLSQIELVLGTGRAVSAVTTRKMRVLPQNKKGTANRALVSFD